MLTSFLIILFHPSVCITSIWSLCAWWDLFILLLFISGLIWNHVFQFFVIFVSLHLQICCVLHDVATVSFWIRQSSDSKNYLIILSAVFFSPSCRSNSSVDAGTLCKQARTGREKGQASLNSGCISTVPL